MSDPIADRDRRIAHLILHGYELRSNTHGWVAIWSADLQKGRMCKYFEDGLDGPGWDVREFISDLALADYSPLPWGWVGDDKLHQLTAPRLPPKYRHDFRAIAREASTFGEVE